MTDNSECCTIGQGNWYDEGGDEAHQGSDGNSDLSLEDREWSISIVEQEEV